MNPQNNWVETEQIFCSVKGYTEAYALNSFLTILRSKEFDYRVIRFVILLQEFVKKKNPFM